MEEILALQQQLAAVQQSSTAQRLSDRNVVELVMKLQALELVQLIFTRNGKEYLTHPQLVLEIQDQIQAQGGRVNLIDLPDVLNVDLHHIQEKMSEIIQPDRSIRLVRGEIITTYYLSTIAEEIDDALAASQHGYDSIGSIATRYALPVDIVREALSSCQNSINATFEPASGTLRSASSITREFAAARGALRAVTTPTLLTEVAKQHAIQSSVMRKVAEQLLSSKEICGVLVGSGSRATFVPEVFSSVTAAVIITGFASNGFIPLQRLRKLFVVDINRFVAENLKSAVVLKECVIGPVLIETLAISAAEAIENDGWLDIASSLPPDFPSGDVALVVDRIVSSLPEAEPPASQSSEGSETGRGRRRRKTGNKHNQKAGKRSHVFDNRFVVSPSICQRCVQIITKNAITKAEERAKAMAQRMDIVVSRSRSTETEAEEGNLKDVGKKDVGKKVKGKGRRRAAGKDRGNQVASTVEMKDSTFPVFIPSIEEIVEILLSEHSFTKVLESDYLESSNDGDDMLAHVIHRIFENDGLRELYERKAAEAVTTLEREEALARQMLEKDLLTRLENAHLFFKSAAMLPSEELSETSRQWITDGVCVDILCRLVNIVARNTGVVHPELREAHSLLSKKEKLEVIRDVCRKLPPTVEAKLRLFIAAVTGKDKSGTNDFLSLYDESTTLLDLPERRPIEKRGERTASANIRAQLTLSLDQEPAVSEVGALHTAVVLAYAKSAGGNMIAFPEETTTKFCEAVEQIIKPYELSNALKELREALSLVNDDESVRTSSSWSQAFATRMEAFRELVR